MDSKVPGNRREGSVNATVNRSASREVASAYGLPPTIQPFVQGRATNNERSMSTTEGSEQTAEQHAPPIGDAGCETKINRGVQGTGYEPGFAQHLARAHAIRSSALIMQGKATQLGYPDLAEMWVEVFEAVKSICMMLDDECGCEEHKQGGS